MACRIIAVVWESLGASAIAGLYLCRDLHARKNRTIGFGGIPTRGAHQTASTLARGLQVLIQMPQAGELPGEAGRTRGERRAPRAEIAAPEEVRLRDHGRAHRAVFVSALRPR